MHDQSMLDSGFLQVMHHSEFGDIIQVGSAYHLSDTKFEIQPSPKLGQHNDEIYKGFLTFPMKNTKHTKPAVQYDCAYVQCLKLHKRIFLRET